MPNIYYFTPMRGDKNLGSAINSHCELVKNEEDWICIIDQDTCFLYPFVSKQIEDVIEKHGETYQLFSCVTNRLGLDWQLPYGLSKDTNISNHYIIAEKHFKEYYDEVVESKSPTAGLFMLFKKKTWFNNKFEDGIITKHGVFIDWYFSASILKKGGKIGIMKGLYLFHYYRLHQKNAREYNHLL